MGMNLRGAERKNLIQKIPKQSLIKLVRQLPKETQQTVAMQLKRSVGKPKSAKPSAVKMRHSPPNINNSNGYSPQRDKPISAPIQRKKKRSKYAAHQRMNKQIAN